MFDAVNAQWQPLFAANGQPNTGGMATEGGQAAYYEPNLGGLGYEGDPGNENGSNGRNDQFLPNLGWTGGNPYNSVAGFGGGVAESQRSQGYDPAFLQFLQ